MINAKLLSEVLEVVVDTNIQYIDNVIMYGEMISDTQCEISQINIYELVHKCKKWIKLNEYIFSLYHYKDTVAISLRSIYNKNHKYTSPAMSIQTEPEAIFKACEWILNNQKDKL